MFRISDGHSAADRGLRRAELTSPAPAGAKVSLSHLARLPPQHKERVTAYTKAMLKRAYGASTGSLTELVGLVNLELSSPGLAPLATDLGGVELRLFGKSTAVSRSTKRARTGKKKQKWEAPPRLNSVQAGARSPPSTSRGAATRRSGRSSVRAATSAPTDRSGCTTMPTARHARRSARTSPGSGASSSRPCSTTPRTCRTWHFSRPLDKAGLKYYGFPVAKAAAAIVHLRVADAGSPEPRPSPADLAALRAAAANELAYRPLRFLIGL